MAEGLFGGGWDAAAGIVARGDGGVIIEGDVSTSADGLYDIWLASIDPDGTIAWQRNIGRPGELELGMSLDHHGGGLLILGRHVSAGGAGHHDLVLARLGADGTSSGGCVLISDGTSSTEDSTVAVMETDASPVATTGVATSVELTFEGVDVPAAALCP